MEKIRAKLKDRDALNAVVERRLEELWTWAVERISDDRVRAAVIYLLEEVVPWQFFVAPASSSGRYHPSWQVEPGGLVRHTTELCIGLHRHLQQFPKLTDENYVPLPKVFDTLLAAGSLHDAFKNGLPWREETDYENHHRIATEKWLEAAAKFRVPEDIRTNAADAIFWHAGRWTPGWTLELHEQRSIFARILHDMDMAFSNVDLNLMYKAKPIPCEGRGVRISSGRETIRFPRPFFFAD